jgi:alkyl hydroperoxide reductase subunit AhpC
MKARIESEAKPMSKTSIPQTKIGRLIAELIEALEAYECLDNQRASCPSAWTSPGW